jgi:hypothetical protein
MCHVMSDVYWYVPYLDAIDAETGSAEWMCMYVCIVFRCRECVIVLDLKLQHTPFIIAGYWPVLHAIKYNGKKTTSFVLR